MQNIKYWSGYLCRCGNWYLAYLKTKSCFNCFDPKPGFLLSRGFYSESHSVLTIDGYILTIFRIINPYIKRKNLKYKPILLWHGLLDSAEAWLKNKHGRLDGKGVYWEDNFTIFNDCNSSLTSTLGFTLSACGYDVWLANNRGNQYAHKHVNLSIAGSFWSYF